MSMVGTFTLIVASELILSMNPKRLISLFLFVYASGLLTLQAQTPICPDEPPANPYVANSPWPIMHRNTFAQQSTCFQGPQATDSLLVRFCRAPFARTSPWLYYTEKYSNGKRAILGSSATHLFKAIDDDLGLRVIDSLRLDFNTLDYSWNHLLLRNKIWISFDYDDIGNVNKIYKFTDRDTSNIYSPIVQAGVIELPNSVQGKATLFNVTQDGWIAFNTTGGTFGVIKPDFSQVISINLPLEAGEVSYHNNFPVDTDNSMFVVTTKKLIKLKWNNPKLTIEWVSPYDFVGNGPTTVLAKGSGTTPTLVGWGNGNDKLVVVADGLNSNNLVAFWRDDVPANWTPLAGRDRRVAGIVNLPGFKNLNNGFQSVENSVCVSGYDMAVAQYNGFSYPCTNAKGVIKCRWDAEKNTLGIVWNNTSVNFNNALTYSRQSNLVYGNGKEADCNYYFYGLDWNTGAVVLRKKLGTSEDYNDQGCNISISDDNSLVEPTSTGFIQVRYDKSAIITAANPGYADDVDFTVFPNPILMPGWVNFRLRGEPSALYMLTIYNAQGQLIHRQQLPNGLTRLDCTTYAKGVYFVRLTQRIDAVEKSVRIKRSKFIIH
jgi:hypothetical protein